MKAYPFDYIRAESVDDVLSALDRYGTEARIIAGGQSLMPMLNFRLARPEVLIDINRLAELSGIEDRGDHIRVGALTRHVDVARSPIIARHVPVVAEAMTHVAHPAVRNRGTLGGSLCLADPAAELPACMVALGADLVVAGNNGRRTVPADAFFMGMFETAVDDGEMLIEVLLPKSGPGTRSAMDEVARRHGDYAIVGAAAVAEMDGPAFRDLRLVYFGVEDKPILARETAAALIGQSWSPALAEDLKSTLAQDLSPNDDSQASSAMRLHLADVLARRLLPRLADPDGPHPSRTENESVSR
ncbi:xanthine dehydrogenase family protein subunit M [Fodinicurvata sp. EGI_FJ10296]|uniref:FAD binding domain-containing protein n=1 Tax=Fodinicurvata sp. EGI_FJ10296 TaxID=3231908 RepID=UPI003451BD5D